MLEVPNSPKASVRAHVRSARRSMPPAARETADAVLVKTLLHLVLDMSARLVAAYVPLPGEPGGARLVDALAGAVPRVLLPVLRDDLDLDWAAYDGTLSPGRFGLSEPVGPRLGVDAIAGVDVVVVPGLAVDLSGVRLGQGGGSYDRALARTTVPTVVPLYPGELVDALPAEPHDRRVAAALVGYEPAHLYWTKAAPMTHDWHSGYPSANDGG